MVGRGLRQTRSYVEFCGERTCLIRAVGGAPLTPPKTTLDAAGFFYEFARGDFSSSAASLCRIELKVLSSDGVIAFEWPREHRIHITSEWMRGISHWHSSAKIFAHWCDSANNTI
jgi:hypothetical protein